MRIEELAEMHSDITDTAVRILKRKGLDYSGEDDTLRLFRMVSACTGGDVTPLEVALIEAIIKMIRIWRLRDTHPANESWKDSVVDDINYLVIAAALHREQPLEEEDEQNPVEG